MKIAIPVVIINAGEATPRYAVVALNPTDTTDAVMAEHFPDRDAFKYQSVALFHNGAWHHYHRDYVLRKKS